MTTSRPVPAPGHMGVDYEERVDFDRLRRYRIDRAKAALESSDCGALLLFDFYNIRYTTSTWIGGALGDKMIRYCLLTRDREPVLWDFGSAVKHHKLHSKWLPDENWRAGFLGFRGAVAPDAGLMASAVTEIKALLAEAGVADAPVGVDIVEPPFLFEMQRQGLSVVDAQQLMLDARVIKSNDEIVLLNQAAAMVDGVYQEIVDVLKPGIRENEIVALANKRLYELGSDQVEAVNAISGERCNPHPHNFTDRIIRPGDQAFFDIIHSFNGYRTCYYRTFGVGSATTAQRDAYKRAREWMDRGIEGIRPGAGTDQIAALLPKATEFGFETEMEAFGLQFAHGLGLGLHERPIISRLNSLENPVELQAGMVFALETYCPASDGISAARIEEEIVVTDDGPVVLTKFPAQELFVANEY
ncbi:Xaa-Pro peptidase family protein [Herbiconiux sp. KACC 21604]|uniref:M24 family metallopeptidase n=1 Tax=unclassified Herbiconiux TaxID=2618217 RepID=UPI001490D452|nr:Xaa-Pro peptidase family protein [Herbiconiux sp. SALV-R1]QJU54948.1 aminopeptidase P family protein [Herbiconiux sp. SALV-R1]WPO86073.1 Xaa-Pro peptidase family protein [Herbiconiux sp. KACC 21604]